MCKTSPETKQWTKTYWLAWDQHTRPCVWPQCLFSNSLEDTDGRERCRECEDLRGRHAETCPQRGISARTPGRESPVCTVLIPPNAWRTQRSTSVLIGSSRATAIKHSFCGRVFFEVVHWPLFIAFSSGSDNSIKGFTGLCVHRVHKAPHGSTTERSQKSMKSLPVGLVKDLSPKTVFASVWHWCRRRAACRKKKC